jgi:hypothetical protein
LLRHELSERVVGLSVAIPIAAYEHFQTHSLGGFVIVDEVLFEILQDKLTHRGDHDLLDAYDQTTALLLKLLYRFVAVVQDLLVQVTEDLDITDAVGLLRERVDPT